MKWLITGGSGLIGKCIVKQMSSSDEAVILDLKDKPQDFDSDRCKWIVGDINDKEALEKIVDDNQVEGIVHLVSLLRGECAKQPYLGVKINVGSLSSVLDIAVSRNITKVIFASSVQVYGAEADYGMGTWIDEDTERKPQTLYGITKCHCEDLAKYYKENHDVNVVGLRFSGVYGYGRSAGPNVYLTDAITQAGNNQDITLPYQDMAQNLVYVKDAAGSVLHCMNGDKYKRAVYNICTGTIITNVDIAKVLQGISPGIKISLEGGDFPIKGATPYTSPAASEKELGFKLKYTLEPALRDYIALAKEAGK